jgi:hypothetical protein
MSEVNATAEMLIRKPVRDVTATGFTGVDAASSAVNATEGFTIIACDLKSLLETGQSGNMVRDKAVLISAAKADA